jgi:Vacuolar protein sorting-associated protein 62
MIALIAAPAVVLFFALTALPGSEPPIKPAEAVAGPEQTCAAGDCQPDLGSDEAAQELADRYVPIVKLREEKSECASDGDPYFPTSVDAAIDQPGVFLGGSSDEETIPTLDFDRTDLDGLDKDWYLDYPGDPIHPGCTFERAFRGLVESMDLPAVAYAHIATEEGEDGIAVQYWFYYYFNDWNNHHEGDWEMIQVTFDANSVEEALDEEPVSVAFSQHGTGETSDWEDGNLEKDEGRPVVYVAHGSHASFLEQAIYLGFGEEGAGFGCDDTTGATRRLDLEAVVIPTTTEGAPDELAWVGFGGRWGEPAGTEFNGPTGPIDKTRFLEPMSWQDGLPSTSVKVPLQNTFGPNAVEIFCDVVEFFSDTLLLLFKTDPIIVYALLIGIAIGAVIAVRQTSFLPRMPLPLVRRRRFGQILTSSLSIYRRAPLLFLGIGAIFIPLGILLDALHALVLETPLVEDLVRLFDSNVVAEALIGLALGFLPTVVAYLMVVAGTAAALRDWDQTKAQRLRSAYASALASADDILLARLVPYALALLLAFTFIGIPWAIRKLVDTTFVEQTIIFEDKERRTATDASAEVVRGNRWWTLGVGVLLVAIGFLLGPVLAILLLFFTDVTPEFANSFSSFLYVALVPYVGIALTLAYFELRERRIEAQPQPPSR